MGTNDYGRFNHTLQECRDGLMRDVAEFGERYELLSKALELLDEEESLVRRWFDLYIAVIDEDSYMKWGREMDCLEKEIERNWYTRHNG